MRSLPLCVLLVIAAGRAPASADGAAEEVSTGSAPHAQGAPAASWVADKLTGIWDPSDDWQLRLDVTGTHYLHGAGDAVLANLAVEYDPDPHWIVRLTAGGSPPSITGSTMAVQVQGPAGAPIDLSGQLDTTASSISGGAWLGYETAGDGDAETSALASATVTRLAIQSQLTAVAGRGGQALTLDQLRALCDANPCAGDVTGALDGRPAHLVQLVLAGGLSEQLYQDTDVGVDGAYYLYDQDPTQLGGAAVARAGTGPALGLAPVRYSVAPSLIHRFGSVMAMSSVAYSKYVGDQGDELAATLRLQVKLALDGDRRVKLWAKLTGSRDVAPMTTTSTAGSAALGVQYSW